MRAEAGAGGSVVPGVVDLDGHHVAVLDLDAPMRADNPALVPIRITQPPGAPLSSVAPLELVLMGLCGLVGWQVAERIGLFGASILGPMILTAALSLAGLIQHRPPAEMIQAAQFFIGIAVGSKYAGITWRELRQAVVAGLVYSLLLAAISLVFIELIVHLGLAPGLDAFLAFLPGGQAEMSMLALIAGADLSFVVVHHIIRVILVLTGAPILFRLMRRRRNQS